MAYDPILKESLKSLRDVKGNLSSVRIKGGSAKGFVWRKIVLND